MKRLITLVVAAAFVLGTVGLAQAIEFKAKGDWQIGIMGVKNPTFDSDDKVDEFEATTRVRTTFEFIANENLKGVMRINSGDRRWGAEGIGREDDTFEFDMAYLDFMIPNTDVNMKVGKQGITLPNTLGSHIMDAWMLQAWAVTASMPITDQVGLTTGWVRAEDRETAGGDKNDEVDYFFGIVPFSFDGFEFNPFGAYGMKGSSAPGANQSSHVWWAGLNFSVDMFDPVVIQGDFNYGRHSSDLSGDPAGSEARGWVAVLAVEYNMDMMTPEVFVLYESGESSSSAEADRRSKVMPTAQGDLYGVSTMTTNGSPLRGIGRNLLNAYAGIDAFGPSGKMAIGARLKDLSFIDNVTHRLQLAYYQGTNHKDNRDINLFTTRDKAWEVTFDTNYKMYENLDAILELGYLAPSLSSDNVDRPEDDAAWKVATGFRYLF